MRILVIMFLTFIAVQTLPAQKVPEDGEKIPLGTDVLAPCSCEGNYCTLWPPPDFAGFPRGFRAEETKKTSFISRGIMIEGQWNKEAGVGGSFVKDPDQRSRCVKVTGSGAVTDELGPGVFSITYPGTYQLEIRTEDISTIADCSGPKCGSLTCLKDDVKTEDRYFTVEAEPGKGCNQPWNKIRQVTDRDGNVLDHQARLSMGLGAPLFFRGQTIRPSQDIVVDVEDGSEWHFLSGSVVNFNECTEESVAHPPTPLKYQISLTLGKIWARITKAVGGEDYPVHIQTERCTDGVRGTTFTVEYDVKTQTTTVVVEEGSVWISNKYGVQKTLIITAGHTGIQIGSQPPRLKK